MGYLLFSILVVGFSQGANANINLSSYEVRPITSGHFAGETLVKFQGTCSPSDWGWMFHATGSCKTPFIYKQCIAGKVEGSFILLGDWLQKSLSISALPKYNATAENETGAAQCEQLKSIIL